MKFEKIELAGQIDYRESLVNKVIFDRVDFRVFLFALKAGQEIKTHSTPVNAFLTIVEGQGFIRIGNENIIMNAGESIVLPKDIPHAVRAEKNFKMMLIK